MVMMMMMMDDLCQKWREKLIFQGIYRLSGTRIVECLQIINLGYNLKQLDVEAERKCNFYFRPQTKMPTKMKFLSRPKNENESHLCLEHSYRYGSVANITFSAQRK